MNFDRLKAKLKKFYELFVAPPKIWGRPNNADILIYDACNAEVLRPYLAAYRLEILHLRGESINGLCLFRAMLAAEFWRSDPIQAYVDAFIRIVKPKLILTYIDNDPGFYTISNRFENVTTMFVQNGTRGEVGDVFSYLKPSDRYHVDYMLVHGMAIGQHYKRFVSGHILPIGSAKNNIVGKYGKPAPRTMLFISQYSPKPVGDTPFLFESDGKPIYWNDFYYTDISVVTFLGKWCRENEWKLIVCGRDFRPIGPEKEFFSHLLRLCNWEYIPRSDVFASYRLIDSSELVVSIDSTLGYEALARGKRTAVLSCRGWPKNRHPFRFGWPEKMPHSGLFWTNDFNLKEFRRILDYLRMVTDFEWEHDRKRAMEHLMVYDFENTQFSSTVREILET
jgi:surface carbohydrate biosynthesis protein